MSGTPPNELAAWKKAYGKLFSVSASGKDYIFRALTFLEYQDVVDIEQETGSIEAEDEIVKLALLQPDPSGFEFDNIPAGLISSLAKEILDVSCFGDPKFARFTLEQHRVRADHVWEIMKAFVLATMPAYKEEELDCLTFDELAKKVVLAEQIIKVNQSAFGIENDMRLDISDPEEEAAQQNRQKQKHAVTKSGQAVPGDPIAARLQSALG